MCLTRCKRAVLVGIVVAAICSGAARIVRAQCQTPEVATVKVFCAQSDILTDRSYRMTNELVVQGYDYDNSDMFKDTNTGDNTTSPCTVGNLRGILLGGHNFWIHSHGGNVIECRIGATETEERYNALVALGYGDYIYDSTTPDPTRYVICLREEGAAAWSTDKKQIIFIAGCSTSRFFDDYNGGLELGYSGGADSDDHELNARLLFQNMSGKLNSGTKRSSGAALAVSGYTSNFRSSGSIESAMVLAPAVTKHSTVVCATNCTAFVEFDCTMKNVTTNLIWRSGCVDLDDESVTWVNDHRVEFDISQATAGQSGTLTVSANHALSANNDVELDGNKVAPNEDNYSWNVSCTAGACDPAFIQPDQRQPEYILMLREERAKRGRIE